MFVVYVFAYGGVPLKLRLESFVLIHFSCLVHAKDMISQHEFYVLLEELALPNNDVRKAAEQKYHSLKENNDIPLLLLSVSRACFTCL